MGRQAPRQYERVAADGPATLRLRLAPLDDNVLKVGGAEIHGALRQEGLGHATFFEQRRLELKDLPARALWLLFRRHRAFTRSGAGGNGSLDC